MPLLGPIWVRYRRFSLRVPGEVALYLTMKAYEVLQHLLHF